jgi:opacity protein-like surface antigen
MIKKSLIGAGLLLATISLNASDIKQNDSGRWFVGFSQASGSGTGSIYYNDVQIGEDIDISPDVTTLTFGKINSNQDRMSFVYTTSTLNSGATDNIGLGFDSIITFQSMRTEKILPYWSGGLEYLKNSDSELSGFAARLGLGLLYNINKDFELNVGYKYNTHYMSYDNDSNLETFAFFNTLGFGLNYKF